MAILDMEFGEAGKVDGVRKKERKRASEAAFKRPEGMHRELYALLVGDNKEPPPLISSETGLPGGYKQVKAKLGLKKARAWQWMEFVNPGRKDGFRLRHWRREVDGGKEYPFAKFNKQVAIESYTDQEYAQHLHHEDWTKAETDHLFDLCQRFDLRFIVIHDRWDRERFDQKQRSVEDLKERYYQTFNALSLIHHPDQSVSRKNYDAVHERKRKEQLIKLYNRSPEQLEEEQELLDEYRKIEQRKKERERKTQDLQKLITDANTSKQKQQQQQRVDMAASQNKSQSRSNRKKVSGSSHRVSGSKEGSGPGTQINLLEAGIKFPEVKNAGPSLRSQRMKLPGSVGQKKSKAIEQLLQELGIELRPMATAEICQHFNEVRSDMVLLYELKMALANSEFELQTLKHQYEALKASGEEKEQQQQQQQQQQPDHDVQPDQAQEEKVRQQSSEQQSQSLAAPAVAAAVAAEMPQLLQQQHQQSQPVQQPEAASREGTQ